MKNPLCLLIGLASMLAFQAHAQTISLSPNTNGRSGVLPNGYDRINFTTGDGDWVEQLVLPSEPRDAMRVDIDTRATYSSTLDISRTDVRMPALRLVTGDRYSLSYSAQTGLWTFVSGTGVARLTPRDGEAVIADYPKKITYLDASNANWAANVALPRLAAGDSVVVVQSSADAGVTVTPANRLYASSASLRKGDSFTFAYQAQYGAWASSGATVRRPQAEEIAANGGTVPLSGSPRTVVELGNGNWTDRIRLPATAGDRDRITIRSQAAWPSDIDPAHTSFTGTMALRTGDEYQFMYAADLARWQLIASPTAFYQAGALADDQLPAMLSPHTVVNASDGNVRTSLRLPQTRRPGDRVTIKTQASQPIAVFDGSRTFTPLTAGESVAYAVDDNGQWQRQTHTIDMLLIHSAASSAQLGADTMRARLIEGLAMTNDALDNSQGHFRFRTVSIRELAAPGTWTTLNHVLSGLIDHAQAQAWRNQARADGIYYEGTEEGCGLGYLRASERYMIGAGSTVCGTIVMRHELGHNMGLDHSEGYTLRGTIMNGNSMAFFAAPYLFVADLGTPLTPPGGWNEMQIMNQHAAVVTRFR